MAVEQQANALSREAEVLISTTSASSTNKLHPITAVQSHLLVHYRQPFLRFDLEPLLAEFVGQAGLVGGFQQCRTAMPMNLDCGTDNAACDLIDLSVSSMLGDLGELPG
jgi:hypothetical protein